MLKSEHTLTVNTAKSEVGTAQLGVGGRVSGGEHHLPGPSLPGMPGMAWLIIQTHLVEMFSLSTAL